MRSLTIRIGRGVGTVAIVLAVVELGLRLSFALNLTGIPLVQPRKEKLDEGWQPESHLFRFESLHPYLGYVGNLDKRPLNPQGWNGVDPLAPKGTNAYRIVITGGSVAGQLFQARGQLRRRLKRHAFFKDKTLEIVGVARGGYKQPQQLQALTYLLAQGAKIDAVINLDGFNEIVLPVVDNWPHNVALSYPRSWRLLGRKGFEPKLAVEVLELRQHQKTLKQLDRWVRSPLGASTTFRTIFTVLTLQAREAEKKALKRIEAVAESNSYQTRGPLKQRSLAQAYEESARIWKRASIQMHRLTKANGIRYFHFLQPNQHVVGSKHTFSAREQKIALWKVPSYRKAVQEGYPSLFRKKKALTREGIWFKDLTQIYLNEPRSTYIDSCCHLNSLGRKQLAQAISKEILRRLSQESSPLAQRSSP